MSITEVYSQVLAIIVNTLLFELPGRQRSTIWGGLPQTFCSNKPHQTTWTTIKSEPSFLGYRLGKWWNIGNYKTIVFCFWPRLFHSLGKISTRMVSLLFTIFVGKFTSFNNVPQIPQILRNGNKHTNFNSE